MRHRSRTLILAQCLVVLLLTAAAERQSRGTGEDTPRQAVSLTLRHATLLNPNSNPVPDANIVIQDGLFVCAGTATACPRPDGAKEVDLAGTYVAPGLIDAHVHYSQTGWVDGRPDAVDLRAKYPYDSVEAALQQHPEYFHKSNLCTGVTSVFDVGGFPWTYALARRTRQANDAPRLVAAGPLLATITVDSQMMGQFVFMSDEPTVRAAVREHRAAGAEAIKVWYIAVPDSLHAHAKAMLMAAGDEARKVGLPLIVHATELPNAKDALEAGAKVLVHDVEEGLIDPAFLTAAKRNGTIVIPTLTVLEGYADVFAGRSPAARYPLDCVDPATRRKLETVLPDSLRKRGNAFWHSPQADSLMSTSLENVRRLYRAGIPIAMGTDAGNPGTAHGPSGYREMELMQQAGMPARAVLASATIVAARAMGLEREVGSIAPKKRADLVVFERDPTADIHNARTVRYVMRNGMLYSRQDLLPK